MIRVVEKRRCGGRVSGVRRTVAFVGGVRGGTRVERGATSEVVFSKSSFFVVLSLNVAHEASPC